jgi:serine/threonine protein kinase
MPVDRYSIINKIGSGAFGSVYTGTVDGGSEIFAIKEIPRKGSQFIHSEITINNRLESHPALLEFYGDIGNSDIAALQFAYFKGKNLWAGYRGCGNVMALSVADKLFRQVGEGFLFLKSAKVIHYDVKPENILWDKKQEIAKIIDFGLAHMEGVNNNRSSGTFQYRAPETLFRWTCSETVDVWGLACIVHEMVTSDYLFPVELKGSCTTAQDTVNLLLAHEYAIGVRRPDTFAIGNQFQQPPVSKDQVKLEGLEKLYLECRKSENDPLARRFAFLVSTCIQWDVPPVETYLGCAKGEYFIKASIL